MSGWAAQEAAEREALGGREPVRPEPEPAGLLRGLRAAVGTLQKGAGGAAAAADAPPPPQAWRAAPPERELFGLALSGGGIRSAIFNVGVLQALARRGFLPGFDYLSTVSGGGYVGGFWSAWQSRDPEARAGRFPEAPEGFAEPPEVRHLRAFGNFLQPRLSLVSLEAGRLVAAVATALLPSLTVAVTVLAAALLLWLGGAWLLLAAAPGLWTPGGWLPRGLVPAAALALGTLAVHAAWEAAGRWSTEEAAARAGRFHAATAGLGLLVAGGLWGGLSHRVPLPFVELVRPPQLDPPPLPHLASLLLPCAAWLAAAGVIVVGRTLFGRRVERHRHRVRLAAADRALAQVVFCAAVWGAAAVLWWVGLLLAAGGLEAVLSAAGVSTAGGGAFAWLRRLLDRRPPQPGRRLSLARPLMLKLLAYLTLAAAVAAVAGLLAWLAGRYGPEAFCALVAVAAVVLAAALVFFDPHESGFHSFYRARLVRGFLGASNADERGRPRFPRATGECEQDDVPLPCLPLRPLHLVCCAANDLSGDPLPTLHRGAESAVLSPLGFQVGSHWRPWPRGAERPGLGEVMTASGAAFNSHMGARSMELGQAATFLLAALNLRLGLWLRTPREDGRLGIRPRLPGLLFFRELFSLSSAEAEWIHLSDGAHFENLALYELVRRHCRFILLSDCGADPERAFGDLGNAVRRIREDFGVEVEIDVTPLRPGGDGHAPQAMVAGDIVYPGGERGTLLYLKPTLTGSEPADVGQYARANPLFPHETTLDQYYDEAQWEAYRRLGEHVVETAFAGLELTDRDVGPAPDPAWELGRLFLHARYRWPALPDTDAGVLARLDQRWATLEGRLRAAEHAALRTQVEPGAGTPRELSDEETVAALPLLHEALQVMELTYLQTGMSAGERAPSHPRFMGWLNRFGRWCGAPAFHRAWPLLAPVQAEPFVRFLVDAFRLAPVERWSGCAVELEVRAADGFALSRWRQVRRAERLAGTRRFAFVVLLGGGRELQAGVVEVTPTGGGARWNTRDFYVPPGLWAVGVGEVFLDRLLEELARRRFTHAEVTVDPDAASTVTDSLYTGAGFRRADDGFRRSLR